MVALLPVPAALVPVLPLRVVAQLPLLELPQLLVLLARDVVVRAQPLLLVPQPQLLAQPRREAAVAQEAVQLRCRSFSAAMAGILPSPGPPMYAPALRSRCRRKRRPCPLT